MTIILSVTHYYIYFVISLQKRIIQKILFKKQYCESNTENKMILILFNQVKKVKI